MSMYSLAASASVVAWLGAAGPADATATPPQEVRSAPAHPGTTQTTLEAEPEASDAAAEAAVPDGLVPPRIVELAPIVYPEPLLEEQPAPEGTVVVRYTVKADGSLRGVEVSTSVHPKLDLIAIEALLRSTHAPGTYGGKPVEVTTSASFSFEAPQSPTPVAEASPPAPAHEISTPLPPVVANGRVLVAGERGPVASATVVATPALDLAEGRVGRRASKTWHKAHPTPEWTIETTTDNEGRFELRGVPDGRTMLTFITQGFERLEYVVTIRKGTIVDGKYYQVRLNTNPYRTVVESTPEPSAEVVRRSASKEEMSKAPGSGGDAVRGLMNFPGFARTPFGVGALVIRGAAPGDSAIYLGGHEIPQLFHFLGQSSTFNSELLGSIDYFPSNFDAKYGDATGGAVALRPRAPRDDGFHGHVNASLFDASALVEGKVGKGRYAAAARRSTIDLILGAVGLTPVSPRYWDYQGLFDYPVANGRLGVRVFGSDDELIALDDQVAGFSNESGYHRADVYYNRAKGPWWFEVSEAFAYNTASSTGNAQTDYTFSTRAEARVRLGDRLGMVFGTETRIGWADIDFTSAAAGFGAGPGGDSGATTARSQRTALVATPSLYATANIRLGRERPVLISPGVRLMAYASPMAKVMADPRLNAQWEISKRWKLKAGVGIYSQGPALSELDEVFGNPDLEVEKSVQSSAGFEVQLPYDMSLDITGFYKHQWDLAVPSDVQVVRNGETVSERYASTGIGRSYGGELLFRRDFSKKLYGWVAYTLSRTEQREPDEDYTLALFDQTHILTVLGGYKLPRNWTVSFRFRLTSGNPTTPAANGIYDATSGNWTAFAAEESSDRLPLFHQLDVRVDKAWTFRRTKLTAFLDIQNLYNAENAEFVVTSYDFRESDRVTSLTFYPSVGLRFEW